MRTTIETDRQIGAALVVGNMIQMSSLVVVAIAIMGILVAEDPRWRWIPIVWVPLPFAMLASVAVSTRQRLLGSSPTEASTRDRERSLITMFMICASAAVLSSWIPTGISLAVAPATAGWGAAALSLGATVGLLVVLRKIRRGLAALMRV